MSEPLYEVDELTIEDFFEYTPELGLACTALALYTIMALVIGYLTERRKGYRFMHLLTVTGLCEAGGYAALVYAIERSGQGSVFNAYVAFQVLVILSPNLIQAALYWTLGVVLSFSPDLVRGRRLLRGWVITTIFACADLLAIAIQAIGISIWATSQSSGDPDQDQIRLGCGITLAGLAIQLIFFIVYSIFAIKVHRHPNNGLAGKPETKRLFIGLYLVMAGLYVRNIFRFVEFVQSTVLTWPPPEGAYVLSEQQWAFYVFDTLPILICVGVYMFIHPGYLLPAKGSGRQLPVLDVEDGSMAAGKSKQFEASTTGGDEAFSVRAVDDGAARWA